MQWGNPDLAPLIGLSWDCGAVTTGPVTVPVLLALGIGVMQSSRKKRLAQAALEGSVAAGAGNALEGFGIVTLASLFPILAVELMSIIDGAIYDTEPLPECTVWVEAARQKEDSVSKEQGTRLDRASVAISKLNRTESESSFEDIESKKSSTIDGGSPKTTEPNNSDEEQSTPPGANGTVDVVTEQPKKKPFILMRWLFACGRWCRHNAPLLVGVALAQIGMISFNEGLAYAFTKLGSQTGQVLPGAFLEVEAVPDSPLYSYAGGLILVLVVIFFIGVLATRAEPALNVLGRTVERLSNGSFTCRMLIASVVYFILAKYAIAVGLTIVTEMQSLPSLGIPLGDHWPSDGALCSLHWHWILRGREIDRGLWHSDNHVCLSNHLRVAHVLLRKPAKAAGRKMSKLNRTFKN
eukprot:jgi/Picre1/28098/NNA_003505.t1